MTEEKTVNSEPTRLTVVIAPEGDTWTLSGSLGPPRRLPNPLSDEGFCYSLLSLRERANELILLTEPDMEARIASLYSLADQVSHRLTLTILSLEAGAEFAERISEGPVQLTIRVDDDSAYADVILALPWELIQVEDGRFPVREGRLDIVREITRPGACALDLPQGPLTVAVCIGAPEDATSLDYEKEAFRLHRALLPLGHRVAYAELGEPDDLIRALDTSNADAVHFNGHGLPGALLFENEYGLSRVVKIQELLEKLAKSSRGHRLPKLFFLSSCHGATRTAEDGGYASALERAMGHGQSTAAALHRYGFAQVVGYFGPVYEAFAVRATEAFYATIAAGHSTIRATAAARLTLCQAIDVHGSAAQCPLAWTQLALYHRGPDHPLALPHEERPNAVPLAFGRKATMVNGLPVLEYGFIGRRRMQHEIRRKVEKEGRRFIVLHGLGGLGKTAIATHMLCNVFAPDEKDRLVLRCQEIEANIDPFAELWRQVDEQGRLLGLDDLNKTLRRVRLESTTPEAGFESAIRAVRAARTKLVIYLDNAESLQSGPNDTAADALGEWQPRARALPAVLKRLSDEGLVLISTRYAWADLDAPARVGVRPMHLADSLRLIASFETLGRLSPETQEKIAQRLDGHPRTVQVLERLVEEYGDEAPGDGEDEWSVLIEPVLPAHGELIRADLLMDQLFERISSQARTHAQNLSVLRVPAPSHVIHALGKLDTMAELVRTGLLSRFPTIHRLRDGSGIERREHFGMQAFVAGFVKSKAPFLQQLDAHRVAGRAYAEMFDQGTLTWEDVDEGIYHLHAAGEGDRAWPMTVDFVFWMRGVTADYRKAISVLESAEEAGLSGDNLALSLLLRAQMHMLIGDHGEGLVEILDRGLSHAAEPLTRASLISEKADLRTRQNAYEEAEQLYRQALEIKDKHAVFGSNDHLPTLHNFAHLLALRGKTRDAEGIFRKILELDDKLGAQDSAKTRHELARVLIEMDQLDEAEQLLRKAIDDKEKALGQREHPDYAASLNELSRVLGRKGQLDEAEMLVRRSMSILEAKVGRLHPAYLTSADQLGSILIEKGDFVSAKNTLEQSIAARVQSLGQDDPSLAVPLFNLATLELLESPLRAEPLAERALAALIRLYGEDHAQVAQALALLAIARDLGAKPNAAQTARKAIEALSKTANISDPDLSEQISVLEKVAAGADNEIPARRLTTQLWEARDLTERGEAGAAIEALTRIAGEAESLDLAPLEASARNLLANLHAQENKRDLAIVEASKVLVLEQQMGNAQAALKVVALLKALGAS